MLKISRGHTILINEGIEEVDPILMPTSKMWKDLQWLIQLVHERNHSTKELNIIIVKQSEQLELFKEAKMLLVQQVKKEKEQITTLKQRVPHHN